MSFMGNGRNGQWRMVLFVGICSLLVVPVGWADQGSQASPLRQGDAAAVHESAQQAAELGVGWQFGKVIRAIQPLLYYSGKIQTGFYSYFDSSEVHPPTNINVDRNWDMSDTAATVRGRMYIRETFFLSYLEKAGATYYRTLLLKGVRDNGGDLLVHQYWYYFPTGEGQYFGAADNGFALVELEQAIPRDRADDETFRQLVVADMERHRDKLKKALAEAKTAEERLQYQTLYDRVVEILKRPVDVPVNYYLVKLYTTSLMLPGDAMDVRVVSYDRQQLKWVQTRPVVYVAQGTHNLVGRRQDFQSGDRCDIPPLTHPRMREAVINLHNPHHPDNPFPGGTNPHGLTFGGTFVEHPIYWIGCRRFLQKRAAGERLEAIKVNWSPHGGQEQKERQGQ